MTMRERLLALVKGDEVDRVPFVQYDGMLGPNREVWDLIGRENMGILRWLRPYEVHHPNCRAVTEDIARDGLKGQRTVMETPRGPMTEERFFEPTYGTAWIGRHFVTEPEDYAPLAAYLEDSVVVPHPERVEETRRDLGEDGLPHVSLLRTPYQQLWVQWVAMEDLALHLVDCPDRVEACIEAMGREQRQVLGVVADAGADYVDFPCNITAPIIGEKYFRQYCVPWYDEAAERLGDDVPVFVHMDGDLKVLWEAIAGSRVRGLDSLSPPPDNDTSPADALALRSDMRVGVNFPSSVHLSPPEVVYATARKFLEQGGHTGRLQIQISENVPQFAWRQSYPEIVRAIRDYSAGS